MDKDKKYRFNNLGGLWYENTINDLLNQYEEKKKNNEDCYNIAMELSELDKEHKEFKRWVKKEAKRRQKIAVLEYLKNHPKDYF